MSFRGIVANVLDIVVSEFKLQSRNYVYFRSDTLEKTMNFNIPTSYGLNCSTNVFL